VLEGRRVFYGITVTPSAKLFEQVRGATLAGVAAPGAAVEARLELALAAAGERRVYRRRGRADQAGRYELVVPYPTVAEAGADVTASGPYSVIAGGQIVGGATVTAADVEGGATVRVR
jgi:hypothetical protein